MKKYLLLLICFCSLTTSFSQNTFPSSGNVGIGTTSPTYPLHISNTGWTEQLLLEGTQDSYSSITFKSNGKRWNIGKRPSFESEAFQLFFHDGSNWSSPYFTVLTNGNLGIGTASPQAKLSVSNSITTNVVATLGLFGYSGSTSNRSMSFQQIGNASTAHQYLFLNGGLGSSSIVGTPTLTSAFAPSFGFECNDNNLNIITSSSGTNVTVKRAMSVSANGNVGIGTASVNDANYKLFVETGIRTRKVKVDVSTWADYVFSPSYKLPSLKQIETFIKQHQHLPEVPSEAEITKEGLDLGENQAILLKKIEELTLYLIEQNKKIEEQQKINEALNARLRKLEGQQNVTK